jgi:8-oxo-dGTP pyrophosphatase MutT (NUDIX family)
VVFDSAGRAFVPRRASTARLPDLWDVVGGHVEPGETVAAALRREVAEETGWTVTGEPRLFYVCEWDLPDEPERTRREFDFIVEVDGDLERPRLAPAEHVEHRWLRRDELDLLDANADVDGGLVRRIIERAFALRVGHELRSPHATVFLDPIASDIEAVRRRWDPVMASQIAAHVTVGYPADIADLDEMTARVAAAANHDAFAIELGAVATDRDPADGVFVGVRDVDRGFARVRHAIVGGRDDGTPAVPHVTLVHPRMSGLGALAWRALDGADLRGRFVTRSVAVTAFDGRRWVTTSEHPLA